MANSSSSMDLKVGLEFDSMQDLRAYVRNICICSAVELRVLASDKTRYTVKCKIEGCPWKLHASIVGNGPSCAIKKLSGKHSCVGTEHLGNKEATADWIATRFVEKICDDQSYSPISIVSDLRREDDITVPYKRAWQAKELAVERINGHQEESYSLLKRYCREILRSNPGSVALVEHDDEHRFTRMYISYAACISAFTHCRQVIGLDGTHLKNRYLGILMTATGIDAAGQPGGSTFLIRDMPPASIG